MMPIIIITIIIIIIIISIIINIIINTIIVIIIVNGEKQLILARLSGLSQLTTQLQHSSWNCYFRKLKRNMRKLKS